MSLVVSLAVAEDRAILPFYPANNPQEDQKDKVESRKNRVRGSAVMERLYEYLAVRKEDLSICLTDSCRTNAKDMLNNRYLGEGRCNALKDAATKDLCIALKSNNCSQLPPAGKDFCQAILDENVNALTRAANSEGFLRYSGGKKVTQVDIQEFLGFYYGFKYYNPMACEKYLFGVPGRMWNKVGYRLLFFEDPDAELDRIVTDLAYFDLSRSKNDPKLCSQIKNPELKKACVSQKAKSIEELF